MTHRHFQIFITAAGEENILRTAEKLRLPPLFVERALCELEEHYGVRLFEGREAGIRLTEEGREFLPHIQRMEEIYRGRDAGAQDKELGGRLRIGLEQGIEYGWLQRFLAMFTEKFPRVRLERREETAVCIHKELQSRCLEIGFLRAGGKTEDMAGRKVRVEQYRAVCARGHSLAYGKLCLEEFLELPLIFERKQTGFFPVFREAVRAAGFETEPVWESSSLASLLRAVRCGLGVTILPRELAEREIRSGCMAEIYLADFFVRSEIWLVWKRGAYRTLPMRALLAEADCACPL